jgi:hypothetical protein
MPEQTSPRCGYIPSCPVYRLWYMWRGEGQSLWQVVENLDRERQEQLAKRLENQEPQRSSIDALTKQNAALISWKRRAELFLLSQGLSLPDD